MEQLMSERILVWVFLMTGPSLIFFLSGLFFLFKYNEACRQRLKNAGGWEKIKHWTIDSLWVTPKNKEERFFYIRYQICVLCFVIYLFLIIFLISNSDSISH
jgi:hypothetical protein